MKYVNIVETGKRFGNMNSKPDFYPKEMSAEERKALFLANRMNAGKHFGFDGHNMFITLQEHVGENSVEIGSSFEITPDFVESYSDGWDADIFEDILIVTDKVPGVVIGHPVADCPVVMMEDPINGVAAIAHCGGEMIDKKLPMMVADALVNAYGSRDEDILTYVSACAGDGWTYNCFPKWATDSDIWKDGIVADVNGIFHIDLRKVIKKQLEERNIRLENIEFNMDDTITNPKYYSNSASSPYGGNDASKAGRHYAGLFYTKGLYKVKTKEK